MISSRCLLVTNIFPPQIGGPATFIPLVAEELVRQGHRVTVVCSSDSRAHAGDAGRPYRVRRIHGPSAARYHLEARRILLTELVSHRAILVNGLESIVFPLARLARRSYLLKVVGDPVWEQARNAGKTTLDIDAFQRDSAVKRAFAAQLDARNAYVRYAKAVVTPSHYLKGVVAGWGAEADRIRVIANGVTQQEGLGAAPPRSPGDVLRLLFVGRLTNWKGVETLLLAIRDLDGVEVVIAGDGPEGPMLAALSRQLGTQAKVTFLGRLSAEKVHAEMGRAHLLLLTSLYEGMSHTLLEAMACGLPAIVSDRGGNREVVEDGQNGLVIPPENPLAMARALQRVRDDEPFRARLSASARAQARNFDIKVTAERFANLLTGATNGA